MILGNFLIFLVLLWRSIPVKSSPSLALSARGGAGASLYELNPNYVPYRTPSSSHHPTWDHDLEAIDARSRQTWSPFRLEQPRFAKQTVLEQVHHALNRLHFISPSLYYTTLSCFLVFVLWQMPFMQPFLRNYFVLSHFNLTKRRIPCILLSAVSHEGLLHLLGNILVLLTFGPPVKQMLRADIWPLLVGAALAGSASFLLLDRNHHGGSLGLSDVTLAIVAVYAKLLPRKRLTTVVAGLVPVQLEAHRLLYYLLGTSVFGVLVQKQSPIAHSSHLGGLLFGIAYYEAWRRYRTRAASRGS